LRAARADTIGLACFGASAAEWGKAREACRRENRRRVHILLTVTYSVLSGGIYMATVGVPSAFWKGSMGANTLVALAVTARGIEGYLVTSVYQSIPEDYGDGYSGTTDGGAESGNNSGSMSAASQVGTMSSTPLA
jgi:hypothetical protein